MIASRFEFIDEDQHPEQYKQLQQYEQPSPQRFSFLDEEQATPQAKLASPKEISVDEALRMPREEFLKLPFEEKARLSKEIGSRARQEALESVASGATVGATERLVKAARPEGYVEVATPEGKAAGEFLGAALPISGMAKAISIPVKALQGSKYIKQLGPAAKWIPTLANITGWSAGGAAYDTAQGLMKHGELPSKEEIAKSAATWGALEAALSSLGHVGRLGKSIGVISKATGEPRRRVLSGLLKEAKTQGIPVGELAKATSEDAIKTISEDFLKYAEDVSKPFEPKIKPEAEIRPEVPVEEASVVAKEKSAPLEVQQRFEFIPETEPMKPSEAVVGVAQEAVPERPSLFKKLKERMGIKDKPIQEKGMDLIRKELGNKWAKEYESHLKWVNDFKEKFPNEADRSDMIFYREKPELIGKTRDAPGTGNPFVNKNETFNDMEKRLSKEAKAFVDTEVDQHFKNALKEFNSSMHTNKINPRDFLENMYLPHFYEGNLKQAADIFSKRFKTNNPLANKRSFLSYNEALQEGGLIPKYKDLSELMHAYDTLMTKFKTNSEIAGKLRQLETDLGKKLILRPGNKRYAEAKAEGWIPFEDPFLRRHVKGKDANGKLIWATSEAPALVHPELAPAIQGVFIRDAKKPSTSAFAKPLSYLLDKVEKLDNFVKRFRLQFSPFHYKTLLESYHAAAGTKQLMKDLFSYDKFTKTADKMLKSAKYMDEPLKAGLVIHPPKEAGFERANLPSETLLKKMELKGGLWKKAAEAYRTASKPFISFQNHLFGKTHPRLKISAYTAYRDNILRHLEKKGITLSPKEYEKMTQGIATLVNNQFGGQRFETMLMFGLNNKGGLSRKALEKIIAYPDWTLSALREVGDAFAKNPVQRKLAHGYLKRYISQLFTTAQLMNFLTTGFYNKQDGSIGWDWDKAHPSWKNEDPTKNPFAIQMPDISITVNGEKIPLGRDEKGRKLYVHEGKKLFEIASYVTDPVKEIFNKSRPMLQTAVEQLFSYSPSLSEPFPVKGKFEGGQFKPWEATKPNTAARLKSRLSHIAEKPVPFSFRAFQHGVGPYAFSFGGAVPISKGGSLHAMQSHLEQAVREKDEKKVQKLMKVLKDNGYETKTINAAVTRARNTVKKEKE